MTLADVRKTSGTPSDRHPGDEPLVAQGSPIYDELIAELGDPTAPSPERDA